MAKVWPPQGDDAPAFGFQTPCCCTVHGPLTNVIEMQPKVGFLTPYGFSGNGAVGRRFRTRTWSGSMHTDYFENCDGGAFIDSQDDSISGSMTITLELQHEDGTYFYLAVCTGALIQNGEPQNGEIVGGCTGNPLTPVSQCPAPGTSTEDIIEYVGGPCADVGGIGCVSEGTLTDAWTNETTSADAIALSDAQPWDENPVTWTPWDGVHLLGPSWAMWYAASDITDPDNVYDQARWRLTRNHLIPLKTYRVTIEVWRVAYSGTPVDETDFSFYATQEIEVDADANGQFTLEPVEVPNAAGFFTTIKPSTLTVELA